MLISLRRDEYYEKKDFAKSSKCRLLWCKYDSDIKIEMKGKKNAKNTFIMLY